MEQDPRWNPTTVNFKVCEVCIYRQKGSECFVVRDKAETTHSIQSEVEVSQKGISAEGSTQVLKFGSIPSMKARLL